MGGRDTVIYKAAILTMTAPVASTVCLREMVKPHGLFGKMTDMKTVSFTKMEDGAKEDYAFLAKHENEFCLALPNRIMSALENLRHSFSGYKIDRLEHSLQTASQFPFSEPSQQSHRLH